VSSGDKSRPLAAVALHEAEDICKSSDLYFTIDHYFEKEVFKHTGLKLHEFLAYPREYITIIFEKIENILHKEAKKAQEITNQINSATKK
jgi:hypothetical protein